MIKYFTNLSSNKIDNIEIRTSVGIHLQAKQVNVIIPERFLLNKIFLKVGYAISKRKVFAVYILQIWQAIISIFLQCLC